ncbi:hypothetical protein AB0M12_05020 [Nocardia vinacea]
MPHRTIPAHPGPPNRGRRRFLIGAAGLATVPVLAATACAGDPAA